MFLYCFYVFCIVFVLFLYCFCIVMFLVDFGMIPLHAYRYTCGIKRRDTKESRNTAVHFLAVKRALLKPLDSKDISALTPAIVPFSVQLA